MANPQLKELVNYVKKAREAGQQDQQTRQVLLKNGWSGAEIDEAFSSAVAAERPQEPAMPQPQLQPRPEVQAQKYQPPTETAKPQYQPQAMPEPAQASAQENLPAQTQFQPAQEPFETKKMRQGGGRHFGLRLAMVLIVIILLVSAGVAGYFAVARSDLFGNFFKNLAFLTPKQQAPAEEQQNTTPAVQETIPAPQVLATKNLAVVPPEYDALKISIATFNSEAGEAIYCAPLKANSIKIACFKNSQKLFDNPYAFGPYWAGTSPNGQRIVFLFYDSAKKQSFAFENGKEGARYLGKTTYPVFSKDSQRFAFMVMGTDGKNFVVLNDKAFAPHEKIFTAPEFSPDGKYVLYGARDGQNILWVADEIK